MVGISCEPYQPMEIKEVPQRFFNVVLEIKRRSEGMTKAAIAR
jgi:hypothetical protein